MEKRRFRLRWDSSPGLSIAGRLLWPLSYTGVRHLLLHSKTSLLYRLVALPCQIYIFINDKTWKLIFHKKPRRCNLDKINISFCYQTLFSSKSLTTITVCPLSCITKGYLQMMARRMNLYQRHLGDVAGTRFHENYLSPLTSDPVMKGAKFLPSHAKKEKFGFYYIWGCFTWLKSALKRTGVLSLSTLECGFKWK